MTDATQKKRRIKAKHVFAVLTLLVAVIALFPAFLALKNNDDTHGIIFNIKQVLGMATPPAPVAPQPGPTGSEPPKDPAPPPPQPLPAPSAELPMGRMASDARLTMSLVSLRPKGPNSRGIVATYALRSVGAPSQPFILSDGNQKGWSVEADRAGHCWQREASALDAFYLSELDAKIPQLPTMSPGQVFYIRAELSCDADPLAGDTAVATATPYVLATDGSRSAVPIRFQSGRVPVTP